MGTRQPACSAHGATQREVFNGALKAALGLCCEYRAANLGEI